MITKTKRNRSFTIPVLIGIIWIIFGLITYGIEASGEGNNETNTIFVIICCHFLFSLIFIILSIVSYKKYIRSFDGNQILEKMEKEIDLKIKWEQFQYDLHIQEREEKLQYDRLEKVLDKINSKPVDDNYALKKDLNELKEAFEELKKEKDQKIYVEIKNQVKRKLKE